MQDQVLQELPAAIDGIRLARGVPVDALQVWISKMMAAAPEDACKSWLAQLLMQLKTSSTDSALSQLLVGALSPEVCGHAYANLGVEQSPTCAQHRLPAY